MITGRQIQAARAMLGWSQQKLADRALISRNAVNRIENDRVDARMDTVDAIMKALSKAGIQFINEPSFEGVRLRTRK